ncbi:MAG: SDR family NAD(P)-dependent oxidoreductase [Sphingomonadaceae bacterium]|nr:SDR family NAD(P)-dependent oxidoreductase [Sphingomonadaceae bacterium]
MTGGTSGLGLEAARRLVEARGHDIVVGARSPDDLPPEIDGKVTALPLDLTRFDSVREFAIEVAKGLPIDVLVLNAGIQLAGAPQKAEGFEKTFAVNHLAHFLLLEILNHALAPHARVIVTGSGTHDPAENTPVTPPDHADAEFLAYPERDPQAPEGGRK